jgi:hypothetical protein
MRQSNSVCFKRDEDLQRLYNDNTCKDFTYYDSNYNINKCVIKKFFLFTVKSKNIYK